MAALGITHTVTRLLRRTALGVALGILLYVAASIWLGVDALATVLADFSWPMLWVALGLSSLNYALRWAKWELGLRWLGVRGAGPDGAPDLGWRRSLAIYLAGLSMSVTPGKLGEVLRSVLLEATDRVPFARTAPIVLADRLSDVLALVALALVGIGQARELGGWLVAAVALVAVAVAVLGRPRVLGALLRAAARLPLVGPALGRQGAAVDSSERLLRPGRLALLTAIGVVGWGLECVGYWSILCGFPGVDPDLRTCTFLWSATTLVGALSFLPGGLGATEGSLVVLAPRLLSGVTQPIAVASAVLIRIATLWWGEIVGALTLAALVRDPGVRERADGVGRADTAG